MITVREREILTYLANGYTIDEVAIQLDRSPQTVKNHIGSAYKKMGVSNRQRAFIKLGWLRPPEILG